MRRVISRSVLGTLIAGLGACAAPPGVPLVSTPRTYQGAGAGAAVGAGGGAPIDSKARGRGAVLGAALGAVLGGSVAEISSRAAREAAARQ